VYYGSIYDPKTYPQGVPNPYGPRVHAWHGGPLNEGTRYHGPVYGRPMATFPWHERPLWGFGDADAAASADSSSTMKTALVFAAGVLAGAVLAELFELYVKRA